MIRKGGSGAWGLLRSQLCSALGAKEPGRLDIRNWIYIYGYRGISMDIGKWIWRHLRSPVPVLNWIALTKFHLFQKILSRVNLHLLVLCVLEFPKSWNRPWQKVKSQKTIKSKQINFPDKFTPSGFSVVEFPQALKRFSWRKSGFTIGDKRRKIDAYWTINWNPVLEFCQIRWFYNRGHCLISCYQKRWKIILQLQGKNQILPLVWKSPKIVAIQHHNLPLSL